MKRLRVFLMMLPLCVSGSVLETSRIVNLTGGGGLQNPNYDGFGMGLSLFASGSNGVDTVSVSTSGIPVELPQSDIQDYYLTNLIFDEVGPCVAGISFPHPACQATINGISGYGAFSNIGGGIGLVQVYEFPLYRPGDEFSTRPGPLLAEAQVFSRAQVTNVSYGVGSYLCPTCPPFPGCAYCPAGQGRFSASFALVADRQDESVSSNSVPEPSTGILGLGGGLLFWLRARARAGQGKCK